MERIELDTSLVTVISRVIDYFYTVIGYLCRNPAKCRDIPTMFRGISRNYPQNERWTRFPGAQLNVTGRFQIRNMKSIWSRDEWAVVFQREWKSAGINVPRAIRANPFFLSFTFLLSFFFATTSFFPLLSLTREIFEISSDYAHAIDVRANSRFRDNWISNVSENYNYSQPIVLRIQERLNTRSLNVVT